MAKKAKAAKKPTAKAIRDRVIEQRKVRAEELLANPANWRKHPDQQRAAFRGLLKEIGFAGSALAYYSERAGGALTLIDGHLRREELGPKFSLACTITDLSDAEADKLLAAYDPVGALAETDRATFDELLKRAAWDDAEVNAMLAQVAKDATVDEPVREVTEDDVPEPPAVPITQPGDLWLLGNHRLLCGDSTKAEDVDRLMAGRIVSAVITDPPYGVSYVGKTKDALPVHNDGKETLLPLLTSALRLAFEKSFPGAIWYVAAPPGPQFYDFATVLRELEVWRQTLVWAKQSLVMGHSDYHYQHEAIFYGWKPGGSHKAPPDRKQTTLWQYDRPTASREHPTMKPVVLFAKMLENSTEVDSLVYEPFCGSGTTLIAAEQLGRKCYGMEISPQYCDVIVKRWENLTGKKATLERRKASRRNARKAS